MSGYITQQAQSLLAQYQNYGRSFVDPSLSIQDRLALAEQIIQLSPVGRNIIDANKALGTRLTVVPEYMWPDQYQQFWGATNNEQIFIRSSVLQDPVSAALLIAHEATHAIDQDNIRNSNLQAHMGVNYLYTQRANAWTEINAFTNEARVAQELGISFRFAGQGYPPAARPLQDKAADPYTGMIRDRQSTLSMILSDPRYSEETQGVQPWDQL